MIFLDQQRCCCLNSIVCVMFSLSGVEERVGEFVCYFSPGLVLIFPRVRFFSWAWPGVLEHPPARGWQGRILWEKVAAHPPGGPIVQHTILIPQYVIPHHTTRRHTTPHQTTLHHGTRTTQQTPSLVLETCGKCNTSRRRLRMEAEQTRTSHADFHLKSTQKYLSIEFDSMTASVTLRVLPGVAFASSPTPEGATLVVELRRA